MMSRQIIGSMALAAMLAGCAAPPAPPVPKDEVATQIEQSIDRVAQEPTFTSSADGKAPSVAAGGPQVSIVFHGDATNLLKRVAAARGIGFKVYGPMPHRDIFVSVDARDISFNEFLEDVGHQMGQLADLALTDAGIEVRYRDHR